MAPRGTVRAKGLLWEQNRYTGAYRKGKNPRRVLSEFTAKPERLRVETLTLIEEQSSECTATYKELVGDFYLRM